MNFLTIGLIVAVAALVAAHLILTLRPRGAVNAPLSAGAFQMTLQNPSFQQLAEASLLTPRLPYSTPADAVSKRIETLERLLLTNGNSILSYNLKEKLRKLDNFRANTEVELAGIKEILVELQQSNGKKGPLSLRGADNSLVTEDLRRIIYRSR